MASERSRRSTDADRAARKRQGPPVGHDGQPARASVIRITIAERQTIFRHGLRDLLSGERDFSVVGEAADLGELNRLVEDRHADVLLLDLAMVQEAGFSTLAHLKDRGRIVLMATALPQRDVLLAVRHGAHGIVSKDVSAPTLFKSIRAVCNDELWLSRHDVAEIVRAFGSAAGATERPAKGLTRREHEVIQQVATGRSNRHIARVLAVSEDTVKHHLTNIFDKTGVSNRVELTLFAQRHDLVRTA
jgi:two-component system nitrate/nitrite response regulator NarL